MQKNQKYTLIALLAYILEQKDIPSRIIGKGCDWHVSGDNNDLDDSEFSISVNLLGTVYIKNSGRTLEAEVQNDRVKVVGTQGYISSASSYGLTEAYSFDISTRSVSFQADKYYQYNVSP
ncbi:MAG: hypothetical protein U9O78_01225 [Patescibacteria group bacterium]|nr:hypothetical protein [Patescibacteria group bacterium]